MQWAGRVKLPTLTDSVMEKFFKSNGNLVSDAHDRNVQQEAILSLRCRRKKYQLRPLYGSRLAWNRSWTFGGGADHALARRLGGMRNRLV